MTLTGITYVGGSENRMGSPNTRLWSKHTKVTKKSETKNLWKPALASKVVNPFTCALAPPFIGIQRDFYIPRLPSNLKNIPSVNMFINVFYIPWFPGLISYIYKPTTSSHFKPELFEMTSLTWPSSNLPSFVHEDHHSSIVPNWDFQQFAGFPASWVSPVSVLKQTTDLRIETKFGSLFMTY
jgi:hypothetical protein